MNKPRGRWRCRACGQEWDGNQLYDDPLYTGVTWTCADLGCGGVCDRCDDPGHHAPSSAGTGKEEEEKWIRYTWCSKTST